MASLGIVVMGWIRDLPVTTDIPKEPSNYIKGRSGCHAKMVSKKRYLSDPRNPGGNRFSGRVWMLPEAANLLLAVLFFGRRRAL
jgi:hypothetical protein